MSTKPLIPTTPTASYYADSSALVKRHIQEVGTLWFRGLTDVASGNVIIIAQLSIIEVFSALNRRRRESSITSADYMTLAAEFARVVRVSDEYEVVPPSVQVIDRARLLLERHPLRAGDAVQLASAMIADDNLRAAGLPSAAFLSADDRLLTAAQAEGLVTDDPRLHP